MRSMSHPVKLHSLFASATSWSSALPQPSWKPISACLVRSPSLRWMASAVYFVPFPCRANVMSAVKIRSSAPGAPLLARAIARQERVGPNQALVLDDLEKAAVSEISVLPATASRSRTRRRGAGRSRTPRFCRHRGVNRFILMCLGVVQHSSTIDGGTSTTRSSTRSSLGCGCGTAWRGSWFLPLR